MDLNELRLRAAEKAFAEADFGDSIVEDSGGWNPDGDFWSCSVYWENPEGGDSIFGSFGVKFAPNTDRIIDQWDQ